MMIPKSTASKVLLLIGVSLLTASTVQTKSPISYSCDISIVGAGIGGLYIAWRLAVDSGKYEGSRICVFEAKRRVGGQWLTVDNPAPGFDGFSLDLGAYRYHRQLHRHVRLLVEKALGFEVHCYTDPLDRDGGKCISNERKIVWTRGKSFGIGVKTTADDAFASYNASSIPYVIPPKYQWGSGKNLKKPREPLDFLLGPNSVVKEIGERWNELAEEKDYGRAMRIADEIIEKMKTGSYHGTPYSKVSLLQAARAEGLTAEEIALYFDTDWDVGDNYTYRMSLLDLGRLWVRYSALRTDQGKGLSATVVPVAKRDGKIRKIGLGSVATRLVRLIRKAGVRIYYDHKATSIRQCFNYWGKDICISFANGRNVKTGRVFLNINKRDLIALGVSSEPLHGSTMAFKRAVEGIEDKGLAKTYCFWEDAWWMTALKQTRGRVRAHGEDIFSLRYHDGNVVCEDPKSLKKCRGALLTSYVLGDSTGAASAIYTHGYNEKPYTPLTNDDNVHRLVRGNVTGAGRLYLDDLHRQLKRIHASSFRALGYPDIDKAIPPPSACIFADWKDIGNHAPIGPQGMVGVDNYKLFTRPARHLPIHLAGEAWGQVTGWAESSVNSAERALYHELNLEKPDWMDDIFHGSVIRRFNGGTS